MKYTLAEAIEELKGNNLVYTDADLTSRINKAIRALSRMKGWQCLRKVFRFSSAGPYFALPQGCAGLVRVCVNGCPTTVRGQDFRFLHSGPGDITVTGPRIPPGFSRVRNVVEDGVSPLMVEPPGPFRLIVYRDAKDKQASFTFTGTDVNTRQVRHTVTVDEMYDWPEFDETGRRVSGTLVEATDSLPFDLMSVDSVVIGSGTETHITVFAEDIHTGDRIPAALYRPDVKIPSFKRYMLPDVRPHQRVELLVEARIDPLPLKDPEDVLPFESLEPIEWMIRSDWEMRSGEVSKGESYRANAANWLAAQEVADDTVQTSFVINSPFAGSPGEISADADNI